MTETPETAPQAEALNKEFDKQPVAPIKRSSRMPAIMMSLVTSFGIGAAAINAMPYFNIEPKFTGFAELFSRETASVPIPDPVVTAALKDIQSGKFAKGWIAEYKGGYKKYNALLKKGEQHSIEKVGSRLRGLMPWMKKRSIKGAQASY